MPTVTALTAINQPNAHCPSYNTLVVIIMVYIICAVRVKQPHQHKMKTHSHTVAPIRHTHIHYPLNMAHIYSTIGQTKHTFTILQTRHTHIHTILKKYTNKSSNAVCFMVGYVGYGKFPQLETN